MTDATAAPEAPTQNQALTNWVDEMAQLTKPQSIHWCDGSAEEYEQLCQQLVDAGTFQRLSDAKRPSSYLAWSDPIRRRARRGPDLHLLCHRGGGGADQQLARPRPRCGPRCAELFDGCMAGRTMYVVPFSMGPLGSDKSRDRRPAHRLPLRGRLDADHDPDGRTRRSRMLGTDGEFVPCVHSVGDPARRGRGGQHLADQRRDEVHRPLSRRPARSGPTAPATAATPCSARSAWRCGSHR